MKKIELESLYRFSSPLRENTSQTNLQSHTKTKQELLTQPKYDKEWRNDVICLTAQQKRHKVYSFEVLLYVRLYKAITEERWYTHKKFHEHRGTTFLVGNRGVFFLHLPP